MWCQTKIAENHKRRGFSLITAHWDRYLRCRKLPNISFKVTFSLMLEKTASRQEVHDLTEDAGITSIGTRRNISR